MKKALILLIIVVIALVLGWLGYQKWFSPDRSMSAQDCEKLGGQVRAATGDGMKDEQIDCGQNSKRIGYVYFLDPSGNPVGEGGRCCLAK